MQKKHLRALVIFLFLLLGSAWLAVGSQAVQAAAPFLQSTPAPDDPTPGPTSTPTPTSTPQPNPITQIFQHVINFDATDSLLSAWTKVLEKAQQKAVEDLEPVLEEAAEQAAGGFLRFSARGLEGLDGEAGESAFLGAIQELWSRVFSVAVLLFPLSVLMNLAAVLISGVSAPVARAEMLEALARSLLTLGVSAGSYLITGVMIKIAWGAAAAVAAEPVSGDAAYLKELFIRLLLSMLRPTTLESLLTIFITLTVLFLGLMAISALVLSYFAVLSLTVSLVALAPLIIVVGSLPEFRWVYAAWIRALVSVLLVPLANAILFKMWAVFTLQGESLVDMLVGLGFICIIVTINFYAGKLVFGPALEAGKLVVASVMGLFHLAVAAVGLVGGLAGFGVAGAVAGSAGLAGIGGSGSSGGGGLTAAGSGVAGSGGGNGSGEVRGSVPAPASVPESGGGFQNRVEAWKRRSFEERQAVDAALEQQGYRQRAAGQVAQSLAGRDPLLRSAAGMWSAGRQAGLAYERAAIQAAERQAAAEERADRGAQVGEPVASPSVQAGARAGWSPPDLADAGAQTVHTVQHGMEPMPPGADGLYPVLFGNPAYDEQGVRLRGWNPSLQANLQRSVQGYHFAAQAIATSASLPDGSAIYDPLEMRPVQVEMRTEANSPAAVAQGGSAAAALSPALFQAASVRFGSPWLSQAGAGLPGARILERSESEQVLRRVAAEFSQEPVGRLAESILETGQDDPGSLTPAEFWERVVLRIHRTNGGDE